MKTLLVKTKAGPFTAYYSKQGLSGLEFPSARSNLLPDESSSRAGPAALRAWQKLTQQAIQNVLAGNSPGIVPPLDLSMGTRFQQEVWGALRAIPLGETRTYAQIAAQIGRPKATRAVGAACGANPIPVLIPCHRVIASDGGLGGFSAGLTWKIKLLSLEGHRAFECQAAMPTRTRRLPQKLFNTSIN